MNRTNHIIKYLLIISIIFLTESFWYETPTRLLAQTKEEGLISINLKDASVNNVLKVLGEKTGIKFVVDPAIQNRRITVNLNDVLPDEAISVIMESNGLGYRSIEGVDVYMVSDLSKIMARTVVKRVSCQFAEAVKLRDILNKIVTPGIGAVLADERTNSLIIKENPEVIDKLEELIGELDKPTPQIYIQAAIAEISLTKNNETGLEWLWKDPNLASSTDRVGTKFNLRQASSGGQSQYTDGEGNPFPFALPIGQGLGIGIVNVHIDAVLRSIQTDYNLNILSRPHLVTLDNQEASIEVGDQIPYKVLSQYGITSYEFKSATVKLLIKPHINNDQTITIEIKPNADFQNGQTPDGIPIIATRKASTQVKVGNGKTIIIGGLMRDSDVQTISKVPILGSIPILGALFRSKINKKEKTELVIFITPKIMHNDLAESELVPEKHLSDDARKKLDKLQSSK
ncbi:MAG: hypothetical protein ISS29_05115 [Candidatus Marinimicrobia bacterium]|nr:hypothetical protein [Candidatus Neomarinimicrobiota bacterium]